MHDANGNTKPFGLQREKEYRENKGRKKIGADFLGTDAEILFFRIFSGIQIMQVHDE